MYDITAITFKAMLMNHYGPWCGALGGTNYILKITFWKSSVVIIHSCVSESWKAQVCMRKKSYSELECECRSSEVPAEWQPYGNLGDEGTEDSSISSTSEWDEADFGAFFLPKACLKELLSWRREKVAHSEGELVFRSRNCVSVTQTNLGGKNSHSS